jgi:outer membrane protein TolC
MEAAMAVIESYRKQLSFAEEDYKMVFEQFKFGLATTVDVIDSDATLISAERSLMNGTYDFQLAILELKHSVGLLLEEYVE